MTVTGTGRIHGITADLADVSEISLVAGALAALADAPSVITGIGHQRLHETDRLAALATEINALGGDVTERADGLEIRPRPLRAGRPVATYDDHRMVMAAAVLGLAVPGLEVAERGTVGKTFPGSRPCGRRCWSALPRPADGPCGPGRRRCAGPAGPRLPAAYPHAGPRTTTPPMRSSPPWSAAGTGA